VKLLALLLLAPALFVGPEASPRIVSVAVGHERATGFVAGDGRVVTVAHVLGNSRAVLVDGRPARVVRADAGLDLALLAVPGVAGEPVRLGDGDDLRLLGRAAPVVRRIRASVDGGERRPALELRAEVEIGESGAPLVTSSGRVAGVVFARSRDRASTAYAVGASGLESLLRGH